MDDKTSIDGLELISIANRMKELGCKIVMQSWTWRLSYMQQSVLISAVRGCDGIPKRHKAKLLLKWYRRCVLLSAFDGRTLTDPFEPGGGSFTGPLAEMPDYLIKGTQFETEDVILNNQYNWRCSILQQVADDFVDSRDELHAHYQDHTMHAFEIIGYKHPMENVRDYWLDIYDRLAKAKHLWPETERQMDERLGDNFTGWNARNDRSTSCSD